MMEIGESTDMDEVVVDNADITQRDDVLEAKHKVFLSHSGVQKDFVEQLCIDLERCDRYPFFDKRRSSLPIGETFPRLIFDAIQQCHIGVVVLSHEFFTKTKWPMIELVAMVRELVAMVRELVRERAKSSIKIIPVFYKLSQEEWLDKDTRLKWISQWEEWASEDERISIDEWKMALNTLKPINSLVMKGGEVQLREEIVKVVCELIPPETRWNDSHARGRSRLCKILIEKINERHQQNGIQVMGVYGIGGIGKTTICRAMCNELFQKFHGRVCHVELNNTSEIDLLREILRRFTNIQHALLDELNIDQCRDKLKRFIVKDPIFLAIDNLSDSRGVRIQAKMLLGTKWGGGSVVIVTTRALGELTCLNQNLSTEDCVEMPELKEDEARSLFLDHVTCGQDARIDFDKGLVSSCLKRCYFSKGEGLGHHYIPLALEVLGEQLGCLGYDVEQWETQLKNADAFEQKLSSDEHPIFSILRTSYNSLSEDAKMLFMDAALYLPSHTFFPRAKYKWSLFKWLSMMHGSSVSEVLEHLEGLKKRSLLANLGDGRTKMVMHDLWREFCVAETAVGKFEDRQWVFLEEESNKLADTSPGPRSCWRNMKRMCFLNKGWRSLKGVELDHFVNLRVLKVDPGSFILPCSSLELDLKGLKHLKSLELKMSATFMTKCIGLGSLANLAYLRWINYTTPSPDIEEIGGLTKLQVLHLEGFKGVKLVDLSMLTSLQLATFRDFVRVATVIGLSSKMTNIQFLDLGTCRKLQECPGLGKLYALEYLYLGHCDELEKVPCLRLLIRLKILNIYCCLLLRAVPGLGDLVALEELWAGGCERLEMLPDLRNLLKLRTLNCVSCMALKCLTCTSPLRALETINLTLCSGLEELPELSNFPQLKGLMLGGCTGLVRLTCSAPLRELLVLDLQGCSKLSTLPDHLGGSVNLRELPLQKSGVVLHEDDIRELLASCKGLLVFLSHALSSCGIVESGCSTVTSLTGSGMEVDDMETSVQNGYRSRRLPDSLAPDKVIKLTYTHAGGSLLALTSNGLHKLWNWGCKLNDPRYQATTNYAPQLWLPDNAMLMNNGLPMTNVTNVADSDDVVPSVAIFYNDHYIVSSFGGKVSVYDIGTFYRVAIMHPHPTPTSLALYPHNNEIMALGLEDSTIQIFNRFENVEMYTLEGHHGKVIGLAFSKSSANSTSVLVSLGADGQLCLWKTEEWSKRHSKFGPLQPHRRTPCMGDIRIQFHIHQRHVLVVGKSQLAIYDILNLDRPIVQWIPNCPFPAVITDATFSCCGRIVSVGFADGSIGILFAHSFQPFSRLTLPIYSPWRPGGTTTYPLAITAHPWNGRQFALGMSDGSVIIVESLASADNNSGSDDKSGSDNESRSGEAASSTAVIQDAIIVGESEEEPRSHVAALTCCCCLNYFFSCLFSTSSVHARSGYSTNGIDSDICKVESDDMIVNEKCGYQSRRLPDTLPLNEISRLIYSNAGDSIFALTSDGMHKCWDWDKEATISAPSYLWKPANGTQIYANDVTYSINLVPSMALSRDNHHLISTLRGEVYVLQLLGTQAIKTSIQTSSAATSLAVHPHQQNIIIIGMADSTIQIYDNHLKEVLCILEGHQKRITGLAFSNDFNVLVSLGADAQLCLWRMEEWREQQTKPGPLQPDWRIQCRGDIRIQFHHDQRGILVVGKSHLEVFDVLNMEQPIAKWVLKSPSAPTITDATYSCDGKSVFVTHSDSSLSELSAHDLCELSVHYVGGITPPIHTPQGESRSTSYPLAIAAHPKKPAQIALGMSDGSVIVVEPWRVPADKASGSGEATGSVAASQDEMS